MGINIAGLNRAEVLAALYNGARPQGLGFLHYSPECMTKEDAQELLDSGETYFDYIQGRVLKIDLEGDEISPRLYDRDNGDGAMSIIIGQLRDTGTISGGDIHDLHLKGVKESCADIGLPNGENSLMEIARSNAMAYR